MFILIVNSKSAGASSLMLAFIEFFIVRQADNKHIVINNIKQIIVVEKTVEDDTGVSIRYMVEAGAIK